MRGYTRRQVQFFYRAALQHDFEKRQNLIDDLCLAMTGKRASEQ